MKLRFEGRANADITEGQDGKELSDIQFRQIRTRAAFSGNAYKKLKYRLQLSFDNGNFSVKDAQIDVPVGSGKMPAPANIFLPMELVVSNESRTLEQSHR
tara:strand:- start:1268 stop:1567 length:300 start_codon:yes stop_codon:yes gene_type:complete